MSPLIYSDFYKIKSVSGFYTTLLIFWSLFQILNILTYNNILAQLGVLPNIVLMSLYLLAWVVMIFNGNKLGLSFVGYLGAIMVIGAVVLSLALTVYPVTDMATGVVQNWQRMSIISNMWDGIAVLVNIVGIFLFLIGCKSSLLLAIVTPMYFVLSFLLNILVSSLLGWMGVTFATAQSGCSVFMLLFILIVLLPSFLVWRKSAIFMASN